MLLLTGRLRVLKRLDGEGGGRGAFCIRRGPFFSPWWGIHGHRRTGEGRLVTRAPRPRGRGKGRHIHTAPAPGRGNARGPRLRGGARRETPEEAVRHPGEPREGGGDLPHSPAVVVGVQHLLSVVFCLGCDGGRAGEAGGQGREGPRRAVFGAEPRGEVAELVDAARSRAQEVIFHPLLRDLHDRLEVKDGNLGRGGGGNGGNVRGDR
mmetsp:Transcript_7273/g.15094  ORF Transcript_7273/g.15094 Transcript_7273/m.15094 type:complete len:208 (+) Transcript_7273:306-929(+)